MPKISVIIPVYNGEMTIRETIKSVLNQTFTDFELIVINDGSTDSTLDAIAQISDPRLQTFSYPNAGANVSRNRGLAKSSGQYISFIDADDLWTPDKLESQYQALQENPDAGLAYSWTDCIDESSQFLRPDSRATFSGDVLAPMLLAYFLSNGSNPLIRRQVFLELGGFDETLTFAQDWEMYLRVARHYPFAVVPKPQVLYRQSASAMSMNVVKKEVAVIQVINRAFDQAPESLQYLKPRSLGNFYKYQTVKALEGTSTRKRGISGFRFYLNALRNDRNLLTAPVTLKVLYKAAVISLFSPPIAQNILAKTPKLSNTSTLLGYINLDTSRSP
ncbi:MAG: glycosyltransferase [Limnospira sp.]